MQVYLYLEINAFALIILFIIYMNIRHKSEKYLTEQKLFLAILTLTALILITDTLIWVLDGTASPFLRIVLICATVLYFILNPIICLAWSLYADFQIFRSGKRIKRFLFPMIIPVFINAALSILSIFYSIYFYFDDKGFYHRGPYFIMVAYICFSIIALTAIFIRINRKHINHNFFISFLLLVLPPMVGAIFQLLFYGLALIWIGMTISILIVFINIQNEQMYIDYLTGLYNRRQLDLYLQELIQKNKVELAGIMLDLNSFKNINDHYGHYTGDEALKYASQLLKKTFDNYGFISRFGGDEFVILLEVCDLAGLNKAIDDLRININEFNMTKKLPYQINFSIGADLYPKEAKMTGKEFLNHIDSLMYKDKKPLLH